MEETAEVMVQVQLLGTPGGYLDAMPGQAFPTIFQAAEVRDLTDKSGNTTKVVKFADTDNNHKLLNFYFDVNAVAGTFNIKKAVTCVILQGKLPIMDNAVFQLTKVVTLQNNTNEQQRCTYEAVIKDVFSDFITRIKNKELTDIKLDDLDHTYSAANVMATYSNTAVQGYAYTMPYGSDNAYMLNEFRPGVFAKIYWDRIIANAGCSYEWAEQDDVNTRFSKQFVPYNGEVPKIREDVKTFYRVEANNLLGTQVQTALAANGEAPSVPAFAVAIPNETLDTSNSFTPGALPLYTSPLYYLGGGNLAFNVKCAWDIIVENTSGATAYAVPATASNKMRYTPVAYLGKNGGLANAGYSNMYNGGVGFYAGAVELASGYAIPPGQTTIQSGLSDMNFAAVLATNTSTYKVSAGLGATSGVQAKWRATNAIGGAEVKVNTILRIRALQLVVQPSMSEIGFGARIYINDFIPKKIKQVDFIKSIITHNNLIVTVDEFNSNHLIFKTRDKFYDEGAQYNWKKKKDKKKEALTQFLPSLSSKKMVFTWKQDTDEPNKTYEAATNEVFGQAEFTFDSEHVSETDRKELIFSPMPTAKTSFGAIVPMIDGTAPKTNIRLVYHGGETACSTYKIIDYYTTAGAEVATSNSKYPFISHFDKPTNPTFDMNFGTADFYFYDTVGTRTNNTFFNLKWRRTIGQINSGKMLTAYFHLTAADIAKMRLSDKIHTDNAWWNINKIEYNANSKASTKVELISVDNEIYFTPFRTRIPSLPSSGDTISLPGKQVVGRIVSHLNVNLSLAPIPILGKNNIVSENVTKGAIYGDGNTVSANALVIGDGMEVTEEGLFVKGTIHSDSMADFCKLGVKTDHIYACTGTIRMHDAVDFDAIPSKGGVSFDAIYQANDATLTGLAAMAGTGYVVEIGVDTFANRSLQAPAAGMTITNPAGIAGNSIFAFSNDLGALEALAGTGIPVRTTTDTWVQRQLQAPAAGFTITNPAGIAGNMIFVLSNDLNAIENLAGTGFAVRTAADTWAQRTITGTAGQIIVTNGTGVAGNPVLSLDPALGLGLWVPGTVGSTNAVKMVTANTASGSNSMAAGFNTSATNNSATATGNATTASGVASFSGGRLATASGDQSFAFGDTVATNGANSFLAGGSSNTISGLGTTSTGMLAGLNNSITGSVSGTSNGATIIGGNTNTIDGSDYAVILGGTNVYIRRYAEVATSCDGSKGQTGTWTAYAATTTNTITEMFASGTERFTIPTDESYYAKITVVGRRSTGTCVSWTMDYLIKNVAGTVTQVGTTAAAMMSDLGGVPVLTVTADNVNKSMKIQVTGLVAANINWFAKVDYTMAK